MTLNVQSRGARETENPRLEFTGSQRPHDLPTRSELTKHPGRRARRVPSWKRERSTGRLSPSGSDHSPDLLPVVKQEPDLYSRHGQRPNLANYTVDNYISVRTPRAHPMFPM